MTRFSPSIARLIGELGKLPGIGQKSAQRLAFHILSQSEEEANELALAIMEAKKNTQLCKICCNLTDRNPCEICSSPGRDAKSICIVESPRDVSAIERMHEYKGRYHVLHGVINPMQNIGPEQIKLRELVQRLQQEPEVGELILATNPTVEGEATALYIARLLKKTGILVTRIAHGLPVGGNLEYADEITLARAIEGRREI